MEDYCDIRDRVRAIGRAGSGAVMATPRGQNLIRRSGPLVPRDKLRISKSPYTLRVAQPGGSPPQVCAPVLLSDDRWERRQAVPSQQGIDDVVEPIDWCIRIRNPEQGSLNRLLSGTIKICFLI
jgi:hypothetical protein